ncbi:MAG: hypothetical protein ACREOK_00630 [Gemmatimonadaceae bacterium]
MTSDRPISRVIPLADGQPMTDELIVQLRARVQSRYYDRPEVVEAVARAIAIRAEAMG